MLKHIGGMTLMDGWLGLTKVKHVSFHFSNVILLLPLNIFLFFQFLCSRIFLVCFSLVFHLHEKLSTI